MAKWEYTQFPKQGPWDPDWVIYDAESDNGDTVASISNTGDPDYDREVTRRNVALIAACPEMLEVCEWALQTAEACFDYTSEFTAPSLERDVAWIRAVIEKAKKVIPA